MSATTDSRVRRWVTNNLPGPFSGESPMDVLRKAYKAGGFEAHMSVGEFRDALERMGHTVRCVRDGDYRLTLPDGQSVGVEARPVP